MAVPSAAAYGPVTMATRPHHPPWSAADAARGRDAERTMVYVDGLLAGVAGAATIALWFLVVDSVQGRPFHTPTVLGTALFRAREGLTDPRFVPTSVEMVLAFTWIHVLVFLVIGLGASWLLTVAERNPHLGFGVILLFVFFEGGFFFAAWFVAQPILQALAWPIVLVGNLLAAAAMAFVLWRRRPGLQIWP